MLIRISQRKVIVETPQRKLMRGIPLRNMMVDYKGNVEKDITGKGDSRDTSEEDDDRNTIEEANGRTPWSNRAYQI